MFLRAEYREPWTYESHDRAGHGATCCVPAPTGSCCSTSSRRGSLLGLGRATATSTGRRRATSSCCPTATSTGWAASSDGRASCRSRRSCRRRRGRRCRCCATAGRRADRCRVRLPAQPRSAVRPGAAGVPAGVRRAPPTGPAAQWVRANIEYALAQPTSTGALERSRRGCPSCCWSRCSGCTWRRRRRPNSGWSAALRDPVLAPALAALHADPERKWTVAELARESRWCRGRCWTRGSARCSGARRSGTSPSGGCTWPQDLLATTDLGVARGRPPRRLRRRRRRSAGRSSAVVATRRASGGRGARRRSETSYGRRVRAPTTRSAIPETAMIGPMIAHIVTPVMALPAR